MPALNQDSSEILREEILADARRKSDEIIRRARQEAEALLAKATADAENMRRERLEQAKAEAARRSELILATIPVEVGRLRAARVETLLESVRDEVLRRLNAHEGLDYREAIVSLATDAVRQMHGSDFIVKLSPADGIVLGESLTNEIKHRAGRLPLNIRVSSNAALREGGVVVEDSDGREVWDNRFASRLERLWPELRRQIAIQASLVIENPPAGGVA